MLVNNAIKKLILAAASAGIAAVGIAAQEGTLLPTEAARNLSKFAGDWVADATLTIEGKPHKVQYHLSGREIADGNGVYVDEWFTDKELGTLRGGNLIGYDPYDGKIHWFSVDNQGTTHEHVGAWTTPDHLVVEHDGTRDGKPYVEKLDVVVRSGGALEFHLVGTLGGRETERGEGVFRKVTSAKH